MQTSTYNLYTKTYPQSTGHKISHVNARMHFMRRGANRDCSVVDEAVPACCHGKPGRLVTQVTRHVTMVLKLKHTKVYHTVFMYKQCEVYYWKLGLPKVSAGFHGC